MLTPIDKDTLYLTFGVKNFTELEENISNMAPSLVEYHLTDISYNQEKEYINKSNIEECISIDSFKLYKDYDGAIFLESNNYDTYEESLW